MRTLMRASEGHIIRDEIVPERTRRGATAPGLGRQSRVFVHNDDVTSMDFVVHILTTVFELAALNAEQVMYTAHIRGNAYVQTLPRPEALRRVGKAKFAARLRSFPLEFSLENE